MQSLTVCFATVWGADGKALNGSFSAILGQRAVPVSVPGRNANKWTFAGLAGH